jgi:hypothetical protein
MSEWLESWDMTSGLGCPRRRCQMAEEVVVVARACDVVVIVSTGDEATLVWGVEGKRIEGAGAVTASEHNMCGKMAYGETPGVELHRAVVVTSEATNREEGMSQTGGNKDVVKVEWSRKN